MPIFISKQRRWHRTELSFFALLDVVMPGSRYANMTTETASILVWFLFADSVLVGPILFRTRRRCRRLCGRDGGARRRRAKAVLLRGDADWLRKGQGHGVQLCLRNLHGLRHWQLLRRWRGKELQTQSLLLRFGELKH